MSTIDQQFVEYIVKSLVGFPDDVVVERIIDEKGVLLTLTVNPDERENYTVSSDDLGDEPVKNSTDEPVDNGSSLARNTRKELAELDDLDI